MAANIYSPLLLASISFFVVFLITLIVFSAVRFNEKYIQQMVDKNTVMVISKKDNKLAPPVVGKKPSPIINNNTPQSAYTNSKPVKRQF